jgi:hypothetical protein
MKKITVRIFDRERRRFVNVMGYRVKIGVVDNEFAATPRFLGWEWRKPMFRNGCWDITHIPTGAVILTHSATIKEAIAEATRQIKLKGEYSYFRAIENAFKATGMKC